MTKRKHNENSSQVCAARQPRLFPHIIFYHRHQCRRRCETSPQSLQNVIIQSNRLYIRVLAMAAQPCACKSNYIAQFRYTACCFKRILKRLRKLYGAISQATHSAVECIKLRKIYCLVTAIKFNDICRVSSVLRELILTHI